MQNIKKTRLIDWFIDCSLTFSDKYFMYIREENKYTNIIQLYRNEGGMEQLGKYGKLDKDESI